MISKLHAKLWLWQIRVLITILKSVHTFDSSKLVNQGKVLISDVNDFVDEQDKIDTSWL